MRTLPGPVHQRVMKEELQLKGRRFQIRLGQGEAQGSAVTVSAVQILMVMHIKTRYSALLVALTDHNVFLQIYREFIGILRDGPDKYRRMNTNRNL